MEVNNMKKLFYFLFLSVMFCSLVLVSGSVGVEGGGVKPDDQGTAVREVIIDVSCFLDNAAVPSKVTIRQSIGQGDPIDIGEPIESEDGRVRFEGIKRIFKEL